MRRSLKKLPDASDATLSELFSNVSDLDKMARLAHTLQRVSPRSKRGRPSFNSALLPDFNPVTSTSPSSGTSDDAFDVLLRSRLLDL